MRYITNFDKERSGKLGSSDIIACIQHPKNTESLAGYGRTALTVWQEKSGLIERDPAGFHATMGNKREPDTIEKFIAENDSVEIAEKFYRDYMYTELEKTADGYPTAPDRQNTNYLHHTTAETDYAVAHADCLRLQIAGDHAEIIEAKSVLSWAAKRGADPYKGYDFKLKKFQGIPYKHYFQVLFQCAIYQEVYGIQIDRAYLALMCDSADFHSWEINIDRKAQERLLEIASYMKKCIDKGTPPKILAMNASDIKIIYPEINEDFRHVSGEELQIVTDAQKQFHEAQSQIKAWKQKEEDSKNTMAVLHKDSGELRGIVDGEIVTFSKWQNRKGGEKVCGLKEIKENQEVYDILKENEFIKETESSRFIKIK